MKILLFLFLPVCFALTARGAEYLFKQKGENLVFACNGRGSLGRVEVQYQAYGYYRVKGPYMIGVLAAPDAFEAASMACGEQFLDEFKDWAGLESYKDH